MSFGQTLRNAREAKGFTPSQVAAQTRILVQIINDMEKEDFHRIPAPIYGRGFVRLFAECVGLAPDPLIQEFMEIYSGRRPPRADIPVPPPVPKPPPPPPVSAPPPPAPEPEPELEPISETPPVVAQNAFTPIPAPEPSLEPEPIPEPIPLPMPPPAPQPMPPPDPAPAPAEQSSTDLSGLDLFTQANNAVNDGKTDEMPNFAPPPTKPAPYPRDGGESPFLPRNYESGGPSAVERFSKSITSVSGNIIDRVVNIPRSTWRICLLGVAAFAILALIVFGCIKLYQATARMPTPDPVAQVPAPSAPVTPTKPVASTKPNTGKPTGTTSGAKPGTTTMANTTAKPSTTQKPGKLNSTGQKIPSLYVD